MKSYLSLIPISAKVHKKQNRMTIICIIIAVFLVTAIFSMADMEIRHQRIKALNMYGNWHIMLKNIPESTAELIETYSDIAFMSDYDVINYKINEEFYIGGKKAALCGTEKQLITNMLATITEGAYPENDSEIMLSTNARDSLKVKIGDNVTVNTPYGNFDYTVSGFGGENDINEKYDAVVAFMTMPAFNKINVPYRLKRGDNPKDNLVHYIQFKRYTNIRNAIANIKEQYGLTDKNISENTALLGITGFSSSSYMMGLYFVAVILFFLVLSAGVLMIAGSLNSNISERTGFFGMLRCIGASKKQIIHFVRLEALNWCKTAIPIGVSLGIAVTWGLCGFLQLMAGSYYREMPQMQVSVIGIVCGIISGMLTVLLAAQSPAKKAAKASPLTASSGNGVNIRNPRRRAYTGFVKIETALGIHHGVSVKKNFILMTLSFALSIILFLSFSAFIGYINNAVKPLQPYTPDISIISPDNTRSLSRDLINEIKGKQGIKRIFGRSFEYNIPVKFGDSNGKIDLISYEEFQFNWAEEGKYIIEGDLSKVLGDSNSVLTVYDKNNPLKVSDKININNSEVEVAGILSDCPFDSEQGTQTVICSEKTFENIMGDCNYTIIDIQLTKKATDEDISTLRDLAGSNIIFSDRRSVNRNAKGGYLAVVLFVYSFLIIIALITIFNIINSISMSVSARIKQYGIMRAIGMEGKQITKMIAAETVTYALAGCIAGCAFGLPLHKLLFNTMITSYFGNPWQIPFIPIAVILILVALSCMAAIYTPAKRIKDMSVTDTINEQ